MKKIDRFTMVKRHNISSSDPKQVLQVGNGEFAFGIDGSGMQTFYGNTMSHWGWHNYPLPEGYTLNDIPYTGTFEQGRLSGPQIWPEEHKNLAAWLFDNPHRLNLGCLRLIRKDNALLVPEELNEMKRHLDLWNGLHTTQFNLDGKRVFVETLVHPGRDLIALRINSPLLDDSAVQVCLDFPDTVLPKRKIEKQQRFITYDHKTEVVSFSDTDATLIRRVTGTNYTVKIAVSNGYVTMNAEKHTFLMTSVPGSNTIEIIVCYSPSENSITDILPNFDEVCTLASRHWKQFWQSGGAIDLSGSKDQRWYELERRIVLSQYLMAVQSAGSQPPPEIGLMGIDPWRGQFHLEMIWWHLAHYALWDRFEMAEKVLGYYQRTKDNAAALAKQLNYKGLMWPKMTGPEGRNSVWKGNNILQWKQPHCIFLAELEYRLRPTNDTLEGKR